ncbi:hypothetical protein RR46_09035 [Papilio xuthus]|uniref:Uncharacterized protein n=1 Tax=Papilio xuthus TaxID=66420 RepID=A0A194PVV6_PAPXU|nr:hypothetical protein RR46_09035 [Papilio xuthus]
MFVVAARRCAVSAHEGAVSAHEGAVSAHEGAVSRPALHARSAPPHACSTQLTLMHSALRCHRSAKVVSGVAMRHSPIMYWEAGAKCPKCWPSSHAPRPRLSTRYTDIHPSTCSNSHKTLDSPSLSDL